MVITAHWNRNLVDPLSKAPLINAIQLQPCGHRLNFTSVQCRQKSVTMERNLGPQAFQDAVGPRSHCIGVSFEDTKQTLTLKEYFICPLDGCEITAIIDDEETRTAVREQLFVDHHPTAYSTAVATIRKLYAAFYNWMFKTKLPAEIYFVDLR